MKTEWIRFAFEELQHVKRVRDIRNLARKYPFFINRIVERTGMCRDTPLALQIEPTNACNLACTCCSRKSLTRGIGFMELRLFRKIIDDAAVNRVGLVFLYLHGEPFLHPGIIEMIAYLKSKGLAVVITTNGMLVDSDVSRRLLSCGMSNADHLIFSVLGNSKQTHEDIMRGVRHEQVVSNIDGILKARKALRRSGPIIETAIYRMPANAREIDDFIARWRGVVDHVRKPAAISEQFAGTGACRSRTVACKNLAERLTVFWNGDVCLCHADLNGMHHFGNLTHVGVREVWTSPALREIRKRHREGDFTGLALCESCDWT